MRRYTILLFVAASALAIGQPQEPGTDLEANLRLVRELRGTERYDRLARNFDRFRVMPPEQQEKLRRLDARLHDEAPETHDRLLHVLGEYTAWLTRLPDDDRQRVLAAANSDERLQLVRAIRERQWVEAQPPARRAEWDRASEVIRKQLVQRWRQEERARHDEWAEARHWDARRWEQMAAERPLMRPLLQEKLPEKVKEFVDIHLMPMLSPDERARLRSPQGEPKRTLPGWLAAVVDLSDRHPVLALKPQYTRRADLPDDYRKALEVPPTRPGMARAINRLPAEGKWPDYPVAVSRLLRTWNVSLKQQLGPSTAAELGTEVERFVGALGPEDKQKLQKVEGKWPEYPLALHEIARERKLAVPVLGLPGDPRFWDAIRNQPGRPRGPAKK